MQEFPNLTILILACSQLSAELIGTFTGASALAWALAIPEDGEVISMDISDEYFISTGEQIITAAGVRGKIKVVVQPALKTLDELLAKDEGGKFDFAFIDADKRSYPDYYERCLSLIHPGGIIAIDNALWHDTVIKGNTNSTGSPFRYPIKPWGEDSNEGTVPIDKLNKTIHADNRVNCSLLPIHDGLMLAFKR